MPTQVKTTACCGVNELDRISTCQTPEEVVKGAYKAYLPVKLGGQELRKIPFLTFTGVVGRLGKDHVSDRKDDYGQALADYITNERLGEVTASPVRLNKQTSTLWPSNHIRIWVWAVDWAALEKWAAGRAIL